MTKRSSLSRSIAAFALVVSSACGQDTDYIRAIERAQADRPAELSSTGRIAPPTEPGRPLTVQGQVFDVDGSPAVAAVIFAYHTDDGGLYDRKGKGPHSWRLRGWVKADAEGRFTFETIRPGAYPNQEILPHLHFTTFLPNGNRYYTPDFNLSPKPPAQGPEVVTATLRLKPNEKF